MISRQGQIRRQKECAIPLPLPFVVQDLKIQVRALWVILFQLFLLIMSSSKWQKKGEGYAMAWRWAVSWTATTTPQPLPMSVVLVTSHFGASVCGKSWTRFYFMHQRAWILMKLSTCMDGCRLRKKCGSTFSADLSLPYICSILFYARKASQIHAHWQA